MDKHCENLNFDTNDARRLANLCGQFGAHLKQIEKRLHVDIRNRGGDFSIHGAKQAVESAADIIRNLYEDTIEGSEITPDHVHLAIQEAGMDTVKNNDVERAYESVVTFRTKKTTVKPRGGNQQSYVSAVRTNDINFGIGPAGTGKTYLGVACAVESLMKDEIERILLVRPAVEAGEKLGFLPGDLSQKVDPYLRPLYDALYEMLGFETVAKYIERNVIEVAPLAYMRGRT